MADRWFLYVSELAQKTQQEVTRSPENWQKFLTTASRFYKSYDFDDQLLIYAQRPNATACAEIGVWNNKMHRWVNAGSNAIGLIRKGTGGKPYIQNVHDVADTHKVRGGKDPWMWQMNESYHAPIIKRLAELKTLIENLTVEARFATDGASNLIQVRGNLPTDQKKLVKYLERLIKELDGIIKKLYEDNFTGKLSDERYMIFSKDYEDEQHTLKAEVEDLRSQIEEQTSKVVNINSFLTVAKKYTSFETLTPGMLHELIEKIVVHEGDKSSGHRIQKIDIYYSFVGDLETSHVVAQRNLKTRKAA